MKSGLEFLIAARECEIAELERLAHASELVNVIGRFVHALQRERGISNIHLASGGSRAGRQRAQQVVLTHAEQGKTLAHFDALDTDASRAPNGARLFSRIAVALHGLDALPELRTRIGALALSTAETTAAYSRHIAHLLAVVFEAADSAGDPDVSRALVAMFNFMQGKEFAGQERAFGGAAFASGRIDAAARQQWQQLIHLQEGCFQVFADFADRAVQAADAHSREALVEADIDRLRRGALLSSGEVDPSLAERWYERCTARLDAMRTVEDVLASHLRGLCAGKVRQARDELRDEQLALEALLKRQERAPSALEARYGPHLERSVLELAQEQARRLQAVSHELDTVRKALNERKVVERAKGLLMAHRHVTEDEAHKLLRTMAMNQKRRLADVAEAILTTAEVLPHRAH